MLTHLKLILGEIYLAVSGLIFKTPTFRVLSGQYPYDVEVQHPSRGENSINIQSSIFKDATTNTVFEFRDENNKLRASIFVPESEMGKPYERRMKLKKVAQRLDEAWHAINLTEDDNFSITESIIKYD